MSLKDKKYYCWRSDFGPQSDLNQDDLDIHIKDSEMSYTDGSKELVKSTYVDVKLTEDVDLAVKQLKSKINEGRFSGDNSHDNRIKRKVLGIVLGLIEEEFE